MSLLFLILNIILTFIPPAYTREAAFVRSIINASMMFLVARYCGEHGHGRSCGCQSDPTYKSETIELRQTRHINTRGDDPKEVTESGTRSDLERLFNLQDLSSSDLDRLKLGLPLRLVKPIIHRQGKIMIHSQHAIFLMNLTNLI